MFRFRVGFLLCLLALTGGELVPAMAGTAPKPDSEYLTINSVEVMELPDPEADAFMGRFAWVDDCTSEGWYDPKASMDDLNTIVAFGEKIWTIVEAGRPKVHIKTPVVHALPPSTKCWMNLENWQAPKSALWQIVYKNLYGIEVVKFKYRVLFNYGGGRNGLGKYVANATVIPAEVNVAWGFSFDAQVQVGRVLNVGTTKSPTAGLQMGVNWTVKTVLKETIRTDNVFLQGDGLMKKLE